MGLIAQLVGKFWLPDSSEVIIKCVEMTVWRRCPSCLQRDTRPQGSCVEETCPFDRDIISVGLRFQRVPRLSALSNCSWFHKSRAAIVMEMYIY